MSIFSQLIDSANRIKHSLSDIRIAVNHKGADIGGQTALNRWDDKIEQNVLITPTEMASDSAGNVTYITPRTAMALPTVNPQEEPLSTTFTATANAMRVLASVDRVIIPAYFQEVSLNFGSDANASSSETRLADLEIDAERITFNYMWALKTLKKITCPNAESVDFKAVGGGDATALALVLPKVTALDVQWGYGTASQIDISGSNLEKLEQFGPSGTGTIRYTKSIGYNHSGTLSLPKCERIEYLQVPRGSMDFTLYTPELRTWRTASGAYNFSESGGSGVFHWYLGGHFTATNSLENALARVNAGRLDIHIPPGPSTTKSTLDGAGIRYTQDYII